MFYKTNATNVVSLAFAPSGDLIAGTESPGRLFSSTRRGKPFVLLDSPYREIHSVRVAPDGTIYAAAMNGAGRRPPVDRAPSSPSRDRPPVPAVSTEITAIAVVDSPPAQTPATRHVTAARPAAAARSTASGPTASGTRCGNPARTRPTT